MGDKFKMAHENGQLYQDLDVYPVLLYTQLILTSKPGLGLQGQETYLSCFYLLKHSGK